MRLVIIRAKTLFATHYHELTRLGEHLDGVDNVHVAELAGVPDPVVDRARDVLRRLREDKAIDVRGSAGGTQQVVFDLGSGGYRGSASADGGESGEASLDPTTESVLEEIEGTDVNDVSPLELMEKVQEWQERL